MKVLANGLARAIRNAPAPERDGQRYNLRVQTTPGPTRVARAQRRPKHTVVEEHQYALVSVEYGRDGVRWFEWTIEL